MLYLASVVFGYLLGSVSFPIIITRLIKGVDIRKYGSGNAGMTNVLRTVGTVPALAVLAGDVLKGVVSAMFGLYLGDIAYAVAGGLAAMAGHTYPAYFGFRGGKGVATGFGVILGLAPDITLIALVIFLLTIIVTRYVSLGSILGAVSVPINSILFEKPLPLIVFAFLAASFVIYRHRSNIVRLCQGKENKIGNRPFRTN